MDHELSNGSLLSFSILGIFGEVHSDALRRPSGHRVLMVSVASVDAKP